MNKKVLYTDNGFPGVDLERSIIGDAGGNLVVAQATSEDEVIELGQDADVLLVQWAPISSRVISALKRCQLIVRLGIGVDNVDVESATKSGIKVSNVPDYCIDEVADHTMALSLAVARQLLPVDSRTRKGTWSIVPPAPMPAFKSMTFGTLGFGRIAREVLRRASAFGFELTTHDPFAPEDAFLDLDVKSVSQSELIEAADILSLHCPLDDSTRHIVNAETLQNMKRGSLIINTSRGGLVDLKSLADALESGHIAGAGLDVFETEPLDPTHRISECRNVILTSHISWYSESSIPTLQRNAAREVSRALSGEPLKYSIN